MKINQKMIVYSLSAFLIATGIVYIMVAYSEYQDYKELADLGIMGGTVEQIVETTFFIISGAIYFGLCIWVLKSGKSKILPYVASIVVSIALIVIYIASRTMGVPIVGVEYYVGRLDILSKVLQVIVIGISGFAIYNIKISSTIKGINKWFKPLSNIYFAICFSFC